MSSKFDERKIHNLFELYDIHKKRYLDHNTMKIAMKDLITRLGVGESDEEYSMIADEALDLYSQDYSGKLYYEDFDKLIKFLHREKGLCL